jgi:hypothetical protein
VVLLFNKGVDDVLVHVKRAKKTDGFTGQSLDARSERQVALMGWPTSRLAFQQIIGT